jgi:hypothetical protein
MNENQDQLQASTNTTKMLCRWLAAMTLVGQLAQAASLSTGFTYQGRLFIGDVPANGLYDLQFTNYNAAAGGHALGGFNTNALPVTNGLFTVTLDFGAVFDGTPRWLEISERTNNVGAFGTLAPRQLLAAAPYATYAASAGTVSGLTINMGAFAAGSGSISGGIDSTAFGDHTQATGGDSTAMGGDTVASGTGSTAMGESTQATGADSTAMGDTTQATGDNSTAIGAGTTASGVASTALGGATIASGDWSTAMGGSTTASGNYSTALGALSVAGGNASFAGGWRAKALHPGSFVWADSTDADFSSTKNDQFLIRAAGGVTVVGDLQVVGKLQAVSGMPSVSWDQQDSSGNTAVSADNVVLAGCTNAQSAPGVFVIQASAQVSMDLGSAFVLNLTGSSNPDTQFTILTTVQSYINPTLVSGKARTTVSLTWVVPTTSITGTTMMFHLVGACVAGTSTVGNRNLTVMYFPKPWDGGAFSGGSGGSPGNGISP